MNRFTSDFWFTPKVFALVAGVVGIVMIAYGIAIFTAIPMMPEARRSSYGVILLDFGASAPLVIFVLFYIQWIRKYYGYYRLMSLLDNWSQKMTTTQWMLGESLYAITKSEKSYIIRIDSPKEITTTITIGNRKFDGRTKPSGKFDPPADVAVYKWICEYDQYSKKHRAITTSTSLRRLSRALKPVLR